MRESKSYLGGIPHEHTCAGSCRAAFRLSSSRSPAVGAGSCTRPWSLLALNGFLLGHKDRAAASLRYLPLPAMEVAIAKWFHSLSASGIAVLITFALNVKEYEEWEGKPIKSQTIWGEEKVSICPGLSTTKLQFRVTEVKSRQQPSPIQALASDTHGSYLSRRIICSGEQGLEKLYLISSLCFFNPHFLSARAFLQLLRSPLQTVSNLSVTAVSRCPLSVVPSDDWQLSLSAAPQTTRLISLTGLHRLSLQSRKGEKKSHMFTQDLYNVSFYDPYQLVAQQNEEHMMILTTYFIYIFVGLLLSVLSKKIMFYLIQAVFFD